MRLCLVDINGPGGGGGGMLGVEEGVGRVCVGPLAVLSET